ncbi:MAG: hypothetical protein J6C23_07695 [Clostridia bacterium]|nr:hypothetical protein [Clostridia bacterium]
MNKKLIITEEINNYFKRINCKVFEEKFNSLLYETMCFLDNFTDIVRDALSNDSEEVRQYVLSKIDLEDEKQVRDYVRFYLENAFVCTFPNRWKKRP